MASDKRTGCFGWAGVAIVAVVALRVCSKAGGDPAPSPAPDASGANSETKPPALAATKLLQAYKANEIKADLEYKGKRFHVTGTVVSIRSDIGDDPQIELVTEPLGVTASGLSKRFAATLNKGDLLEGDCTVTGSVMGSPMIDCSR